MKNYGKVINLYPGKLGISDYDISFIREWDNKVGRDYGKNKDIK